MAAGARSIKTDYEGGKIKGLHWLMECGQREAIFRMPVRIDPIFALINGERTSPEKWVERDREQAERVAWRQLLRWVQAQLAFSETNMVRAEEVFSPYMVVNAQGQTVFESLEAGTLMKLLEAAK